MLGINMLQYFEVSLWTEKLSERSASMIFEL